MGEKVWCLCASQKLGLDYSYTKAVHKDERNYINACLWDLANLAVALEKMPYFTMF